MTDKERLEIGNTILNQLGGRRFVGFTGARGFVVGAGKEKWMTTLTFRTGFHHVVAIEYRPVPDYYYVTITHYGKPVCADIEVDAFSLEGFVAEKTGLVTHF